MVTDYKEQAQLLSWKGHRLGANENNHFRFSKNDKVTNQAREKFKKLILGMKRRTRSVLAARKINIGSCELIDNNLQDKRISKLRNELIKIMTAICTNKRNSA